MGWFNKEEPVVQSAPMTVQAQPAVVELVSEPEVQGKPHANIMRHVVRVRRINDALARDEYPPAKRRALEKEKKRILGFMGLTEEKFSQVFEDA